MPAKRKIDKLLIRFFFIWPNNKDFSLRRQKENVEATGRFKDSTQTNKDFFD